jgi:hypothetical protein
VTALTIFWSAMTAVLHGCFEILCALLGVAVAASFGVLLIVMIGGAIMHVISDGTQVV